MKKVISPISKVLWKVNFTGKWLMTLDQQLTNRITLCKKLFPFMNFFHLRVLPLILHRAIIKLLFLVREKELPILIFLNIHVTLNGSIW